MKPEDSIYQQYINILKEELRPAMGCTEPIALAYAGAKGRQLLGAFRTGSRPMSAVILLRTSKVSSFPIPMDFMALPRPSAPVWWRVRLKSSWRSSVK